MSIALIAGLGNPGDRYVATRHNVGFQFVDCLRRAFGFTLAPDKKFNGDTGLFTVADNTVRVITPTTMMNLSGQALAPFANFYRVRPEQILVIHDELALAPGCVRLKRGGGHGGHNGLRDIITKLGSADFLRLRIGIGHPGTNRDVSGYVLHDPSADDGIEIARAMESAVTVMDTVIAGDVDAAMLKLHSEPSPSL